MDYTALGIFITVILEALYLAHKLGVIEKAIKVLEQKQEKHNNLMERTFINEQKISVLENQLTNDEDKIKDLEDIKHEYFKNRY
jgi:hypothetical protein